MVAILAALAFLAGVMVAPPAAAAKKPEKEAGEQVNRGYRAAKRGYWQEALFRFRRASALTPNDPRVLNNIAVALEASGRFEEALVAYETALAVAPNDRVLRQNYSWFREFYESQVSPKESADEQAAKPDEAASTSDDKEADDA